MSDEKKPALTQEEIDRRISEARTHAQSQAQEPTEPETTEPTKPNSKKPKRKDESAIASRTSDQLSSATNQSAQELVATEQQAKKARIAGGMQKGINDAQDIRGGYQLGLMEGVTQGIANDNAQFIQGLVGGLSQHAEETVDVGEMLAQVRAKKNPLESLDLQTDTSSQTQIKPFNIFE